MHISRFQIKGFLYMLSCESELPERFFEESPLLAQLAFDVYHVSQGDGPHAHDRLPVLDLWLPVAETDARPKRKIDRKDLPSGILDNERDRVVKLRVA
jgi:hypothetical protein